MSATTSTHAHAPTLDAMSKVAVLLVEHRAEIPPVHVDVTQYGSVILNVAASNTFSEQHRKAAVDLIARILHLAPAEVTDRGVYRTGNAEWTVITPVHQTCPTCQKPAVR